MDGEDNYKLLEGDEIVTLVKENEDKNEVESENEEMEDNRKVKKMAYSGKIKNH